MRLAWSSFTREWRRFLACRRGTPLLEFALAAPVLLLLMIGMFEVAMLTFTNVSVEGALREAARWGITGRTPVSGTREQQILAIIAQKTYGLIDMDDAEVTFKVYDSFNDIGQPEPFVDSILPLNGKYDLGESFTDLNGNLKWDADRGAEGVGNSGEVVLYTIAYEWHAMTPFIGSMLGDNGTLTMSASVAVRNEPWCFLNVC
jgi:hypothetical protein